MLPINEMFFRKLVFQEASHSMLKSDLCSQWLLGLWQLLSGNVEYVYY